MPATGITRTVKRPKPDRVVVRLRVDKAAYDEAAKAEFRKQGRRVKLPGFRPGKVPVSVLEKMLSPEAIEEGVAHSLWEAEARAVLEEEGIRPLRLLRLDHKGERRGGISIEAEIEAEPEFKVPDPEKIDVEVEIPAEVDDARVEREIERLVERESHLVPVQAIEEGTYFRLEGTFKAGEDEEEVGRAFEARAETLPSPKFLENMQGKAKGETVKFRTKFSEGYSDAALAGKMVSVDAEVVSVRAEKVANEETISANYGLSGPDELRQRVRAQLVQGREESIFDQVGAKIPEALLAKAGKFPVPEVLVEEARADAWEDAQAAARSKGEEPPAEDEWWKAAAEPVANGVRVGLIYDRLAEGWGVDAGNLDLELFYRDVARRVGRPVRKIVQEAKRRGELPVVARRIRHAKVARRIARGILERKEAA